MSHICEIAACLDDFNETEVFDNKTKVNILLDISGYPAVSTICFIKAAQLYLD